MSSNDFPDFGPDSPDFLSALMGDLNTMMATPVDGPVAWQLAKETALAIAATPLLEAGVSIDSLETNLGETDPDSASAHTSPADSPIDVEANLRLADLWLDPVTSWPTGITLTHAWSPADWVEATLPVWRRLCDPVAATVARTMRESMTEGLNAIKESPESMDELNAQLGESLPPGLSLPAGFDASQFADSLGPLMEMLERVCAVMLGGQIGQAIGRLSGDVQTSSDIGIPLGPLGHAAILPASLATFSAGIGVDRDQAALYIALREAAHQRLYAHVPWLRGHVLAAIEAYAAGVEVDPQALQARISDAVTGLDPQQLADPEALQNAIASGVFAVEPSAAQQTALARLESLLALIEGWVEHVVGKAADGRLPALESLRESVRRRRAAGGPAEQTFSALVGLDFRPRRLRIAADLWGELERRGGASGRDEIWSHPDLLPSSADLDDPTDFLHPPAEDPDLS